MAGIASGKTWSRIGPEVAPTSSAASGVWTLQELAENEGAGTWPAPKADYEVLATYTADGSNNTVSFTSIPQTFRTLRIVMRSASTASSGPIVSIRYNSDNTVGNYDYVSIYNANAANDISGSSATSQSRISQGDTVIRTSDGISYTLIDILQYNTGSGTQAFVKYGTHQNNGYATGLFQVHYGISTAVTSLQLLANNTSSNYHYQTPTTITLYGIGNA